MQGDSMTKDECFEKLAPEVKLFLDRINQLSAPPLSMRTYKGMRQYVLSMVKQVERPHFTGTIEERTIPGPGGDIPIRIYIPEGPTPLPILLFFHGGAWVLGNLDTEEDTCLALARLTPCIAVSVDYRLAPEHPYPSALDDCYATLQWAAEKADTFGGDQGRIAVSGESAGGNLAAALALMSRHRKGPAIAFQLLFYPVTNLAEWNTESHRAFREGFFLKEEDMAGARSLYAPNEADWSSPYLSPLLATDLRGLPPALVVTAGCDPLGDEGEAYAKRLQNSGVHASHVCYEDMIHAFLFFFKSSASRSKALEHASEELRRAFA